MDDEMNASRAALSAQYSDTSQNPYHSPALPARLFRACYQPVSIRDSRNSETVKINENPGSILLIERSERLGDIGVRAHECQRRVAW